MSKWKKNREATTKTVCDPETIKYFMFGTLQKTFANPTINKYAQTNAHTPTGNKSEIG